MPYFDRETLYQQVWDQPVTAVAKQYAVSDVRLHKVCRQLKVPTPQAGYWAKKAAGKKLPPQPKLPPYDGPSVFYQDPEEKARRKALATQPPEPDELTPYRLKEERASAKIEVPETLRRPLPIVAETKQELLKRTDVPPV